MIESQFGDRGSRAQIEREEAVPAAVQCQLPSEAIEQFHGRVLGW
jgi:hypothetical protein